MSNRTKRPLAACIVIILLACLLAACSSSQPAALDDEDSGQGFGKPIASALTMVTGSSGGGAWTLGASLAELVKEDNPSIDITVQPGQPIPNIVNVQDKEADIGYTYTAFIRSALRSEGDFEGRAAAADLRAIATLEPNFLVTVVRPDTPIRSFADIKNKEYPLKLAMHPPGSTPYFLATPLLQAYGIDLDDIPKWGGKVQTVSGHAEAVSLIADGHMNSWIMIAAFAHPGLTELLTNREMNFVPLDPDVAKQIEEDTGFQPFTIPAGSFKGQEEDVLTLGMHPVLVVNKNVPDDVVYEITKTLCEKKDDLAISATAKKVMDPKTWWNDTVAPLHPGAEKYYEEKGYK